jgi:integration host factor subunit beta
MKGRKINRTYTKKDKAKRVVEISHDSSRKAGQCIDRTFTAMRDIILQSEPELRIEIRDYSVFEVKHTKPKARNPKSGVQIFVPARGKIHFKPGKSQKHYLPQPISENISMLAGKGN